MNCSTVTIASCAGLSPGLPRPRTRRRNPHPHTPAQLIADPDGQAPLTGRRLRHPGGSSGTSGHGRGCIDMMTRFCGQARGRTRGKATAEKIMNYRRAAALEAPRRAAE